MVLVEFHCHLFKSGTPGSFQPITASSVGSSCRYQFRRRNSDVPSSISLMSPFLSPGSLGPICDVTTSPAYNFAMYCAYALGSAQMLAPVTALFGATVGSVQPAAAASSGATTARALRVLRFMSWSLL